MKIYYKYDEYRNVAKTDCPFGQTYDYDTPTSRKIHCKVGGYACVKTCKYNMGDNVEERYIICGHLNTKFVKRFLKEL